MPQIWLIKDWVEDVRLYCSGLSIPSIWYLSRIVALVLVKEMLLLSVRKAFIRRAVPYYLPYLDDSYCRYIFFPSHIC